MTVTTNPTSRGPTISVITVALEAEKTIGRTIDSVERQVSRPDEYIIVDGGSKDATVSIARGHGSTVSNLVTGRDEGIFDAMNRGLGLARGDVVGFLNANDIYADDYSIARVREVLSDPQIEACYGDLDFVNRNGRVVRRWRSKEYTRQLLDAGWVPAHPTFYCRRSVLLEVGGFRKHYEVAGDYELFIRLFAIRGLATRHIPEVQVRMEAGGASNGSIRKIFLGAREVSLAWRDNRLVPPPLVGLRKVLPKFGQLWHRK